MISASVRDLGPVRRLAARFHAYDFPGDKHSASKPLGLEVVRVAHCGCRTHSGAASDGPYCGSALADAARRGSLRDFPEHDGPSRGSR